MKNRYLIILFITLMTILATTLPVYATITAPSSVTIPDVKVFRNVAAANDTLYIFEYNINYAGNYTATYPIPAADSWLFRLYDTDNVTLKATTQPYLFSYFGSDGYGMGVSSLYFGPSDNASAWGSAVVINLYGVPAYYSPAISISYTLTNANYVSLTSQEDNRNELAAFIIELANRLQVNYSSMTETLMTTSSSGIVLANYGEIYFRGAILGLQTLCPQIFILQEYIPQPMTSNTTYDMLMGTTYSGRLATDDIKKGIDRLGSLMGISGGFTAAAICFIICIAICIITSKKGWGIEIGLGVSALVVIFFSLILGDIMYTVMMISALIAAIGLAYLFLFKKAY